jgi:mRNA interferase MazF
MITIKKWTIYLANLEPVIGSEQGKMRPVLVVSENEINDLLNCVNILPITSKKLNRTIYPNEVLLVVGVGGLPNESIVLCHQIRTIDKQRLTKYYGAIEDIVLQHRIIEAICFQLGISFDTLLSLDDFSPE